MLFRNEEKDMRENLIKSDLVECVIGLGPNLFFNSPMEACIVICRTTKRPDRRGQILMINAINEVTRKNAQSYLEEGHIQKIANSYLNYENIDNFSKVITIEDTIKNDFSLSIPLYVSQQPEDIREDKRSLSECIEAWQESNFELKIVFKELKTILNETAGDVSD